MSKQIVLVDDDQGTLLITKNILVNEGYRVEMFTDPNDAFDYINQNEIDLLLIDIMMPAMNGVEAVKNLINNNPDKVFKVLFLTGIFNQNQSENEGVVIDGHKYDIICKPVDPQRLISLMRSIFS